MDTISVDGYEFAFVESGEGAPIILVHGTLTDHRTWAHQRRHLADQFRVIAYSRRYHYPNETPTDAGPDYSVSVHASDLVEIIEALGVGPVTVVGSSYGGYVGLTAAMERPDLFEGLVLGEPPVIPLLLPNPKNPVHLIRLLVTDFAAARSLISFRRRVHRPAMSAFEDDDVEEGVRRFANGVLGEGRYEELPDRATERFLENAPALKAEMLGPGFPPFPRETAASLDIPTMLLRGERTRAFLRAIAERLDELLPRSEHHVLPDAGHAMHVDAPEAFNRRIRDFVD